MIAVGFAGTDALCAAYPLALGVLGFTSPEQRGRLGRLVTR